MNIKIPELSLVLLIGPSGCGKSTFGRAHFKPTEVTSRPTSAADLFRMMKTIRSRRRKLLNYSTSSFANDWPPADLRSSTQLTFRQSLASH